MKLILDAHLDLAWSAIQWDRDLTLPVEATRKAEAHQTDSRARGRNTLTLPELKKAGVAVCLATILSRCKPTLRPEKGFDRRGLDWNTAAGCYAMGQAQLAYYQLLESQGQLRFLRTAADLKTHWAAYEKNPATTPLGILLAMEGADPIVTPAQAEQWFGHGLRCVSLAHYGPGRYAMGTGFEGPLTADGKELLRAFERLGMIVDLTHTAEPGFFHVLDHFNGRVLASHQMCRSLTPADRQFSDDQLNRLIQRDAVIGMAFDAWMLKPGWTIGESDPATVSLEDAANHIDHIAQLAGSVRNIGIGSDLDGGFGTEQTPRDLDTIADLQKLGEILARRNYSDADIAAIFSGNFLRLFIESLPA